MQYLELWRVEIWDGGDRTNPNGFYFDNEEAAKEFKQKHTYDSYYKVSLKICSTMQDYTDSQASKLKEQALSKLTPAERNALGF